MRKFKIKGNVHNGNYKNLKIIDIETGEEIENLRGITIVFKVHEMATVNLEYYADDIEFDLKVIQDENRKIKENEE